MIIHIVGPSGSGKSTLGNKLINKYKTNKNIKIIDTDDIDDPNSIKLVNKYNFETRKNENDIYRELAKMNKKELIEIIKKYDIVVLVGFLHAGMYYIKNKIDYKFSIRIEPEILYKQYNDRTLTSIKNNYDEIKKIINSNIHIKKKHFIMSKKYKIRDGFECVGLEEITESVKRNKKRAKDNGYKYLISDKIFTEIIKIIDNNINNI